VSLSSEALQLFYLLQVQSEGLLTPARARAFEARASKNALKKSLFTHDTCMRIKMLRASFFRTNIMTASTIRMYISTITTRPNPKAKTKTSLNIVC
jgi:hypothetical protein